LPIIGGRIVAARGLSRNPARRFARLASGFGPKANPSNAKFGVCRAIRQQLTRASEIAHLPVRASEHFTSEVMLWIAIERLHVNLDDVHELPDLKEHNLVALSDALSGLATFDARMSQVVELRFFGGLTVDETAHVLNVSPETVMRDWKTAKAWLLREIRRGHITAAS
jgi:RNA polymerase sigma factor (sigma-70 family)